MKDVGEALGILIIVFYSLALLNFIIKYIFKYYRTTLQKNKEFFTLYKKVMKFFVKFHRYFGMTAILCIFAHFYVQFTTKGLRLTGAFAASLMLIQAGLGMYGIYSKKKWKHWITVHRVLAIMIGVAILIHIL